METYSFKTGRSINQAVCIVAIFYLLYFGGSACLDPYITLYFRQLGLSASQVGFICGFKSIIWVFITPVWISCARSLQKVKIALAVAVCAAIVGNISISFVPAANEESVYKECLSKTYNLFQCLDPKNCTMKYAASEVKLISQSFTSHTTIIPSTTLFKASVHHSSTTPNEYLQELSTLGERNNRTIISDSSTFHYSTATAFIAQVRSPYQMALHLLAKIDAAKLSSVPEIGDFVSRQEETKRWPHWRQKVLVQNVVALLNSQHRYSFEKKQKSLSKNNLNSDFLPTNLKSKSMPSNRKSSSNVHKIAQKLFPFFFVKKSSNPSLTSEEFLKSYSSLNAFPQSFRNTLSQSLQLMWNKYLNVLDYKRSKREVILSDTNELNVTNLLNSGLINESQSKSVEAVIHESLTKNMEIFALIMILVIATEVMAAPIGLLTDNSLYEWLDEMEGLKLHGKHRIFGLVATVFSGLLVAVGIYYLPCYIFDYISKFRLHFYAFAFFAGLSLFLIPVFPTVDYRFPHRSPTLVLSLCPLLNVGMRQDCRRCLLFFTVVFAGMFLAVEQNFLLWQVQDLPSSSYLIYGSIVSGNAAATLFTVFVGKKLFRKLNSTLIIPLSLLCIGIKFALYSFLNQPWFFVPAQVLSIGGIPLLWLVVESEISRMTTWQDESDWSKRNEQVHVFSKPSQKRKLYISYFCAYQGLGFFLGSISCGIVYDIEGESLVRVFRACAILCLIWSSVYFLCQQCCIKKAQHRRYLMLLGDDGDDDNDIYPDVTEKLRQPSKGFEAKSKYFEKTKVVGKSRRKRRTKKSEDLNLSDNELEQDWKMMSLRKEGHII